MRKLKSDECLRLWEGEIDGHNERQTVGLDQHCVPVEGLAVVGHSSRLSRSDSGVGSFQVVRVTGVVSEDGL